MAWISRFGFLSLATSILLLAGYSDPSSKPPAAGTTATLALLETTDLHSNVLSYDYYKVTQDESLSFERTATLIKAARAEFPNTMLFDAGDTIQGTVMADYQAQVKPVSCGETLAIYKAMNAVGYDAGTIGNHEFNYGLAFLSQVTGRLLNVDVEGLPTRQCAGPNFPLLLANVNSSKDGQPLYPPYTLLHRMLNATTPDGRAVRAPIQVGVIGFTPPPILRWDQRWLNGKVYITDALAQAQHYVQEMRAKGADLVIILLHGGLDDSLYTPTMEQLGYHLSKVSGIDALLLGHSHQIFPNASSTLAQFLLPGVDRANGFVNGVPATMANYWGKNLGVIKLNLVYGHHGWYVDRTQTKVEARSTRNPDGRYVDADPSIAPLVATEHQAAIDYVKTPIGDTDFRMSTYFADVGDVTAIQIVNEAQSAYVRDYIQANLPQYKNLPVLSLSAPFKSGFAGGNDYTDVAAGSLAIYNAADLYLYPNTVYAVKITGAELKSWLEQAARRFNKINPAKTDVQELISHYPGYLFDMFTTPDLTYQIDVTQPTDSRIVDLRYRGAAIDPAAEFIIATNNFRASSGGSFIGIDGDRTVYASPDTNRDVLIAYIKKRGHLTRSANGSSRSWRFKQTATAGPVVFHSSQGKLAVAAAAGLNNLSLYQADDGRGKDMSTYRIDLSQ